MRNLLFSLPFLFLFAIHIQAQSFGPIDYVPGEVIIMTESASDIEEVLRIIEEKSGASISQAERLSQYLNLWLLKFDAQQVATQSVVNVANTSRLIRSAQLNHTNVELRNTPDDPLFPSQWPYDVIDAELAWNVTTGGLTALGDTIVVAVIDGGFQLEHPDLTANYFVNHAEIAGNNIDDDGNGFIDDVSGWNFYGDSPSHPTDQHGSHVSGTVGAIGNNAEGVAGVNWNVKVLPISGSSGQESLVVSAYGYVYDMRKRYNETQGEEGAYIVATNSSFGVNFGQPEDYPIWCDMYDKMGEEGILSAGATINSNINVDVEGDIPTACESDFLVSVTNTNIADVRNSGAGFGITTIDLGAPGTNVESTTLNGNYGGLTGTSMATPHVAGAIALMYSAMCEKTMFNYQNDPEGLALYMKDKLLTQGIDQVSSLQSEVVSGGRLNLYKAVRSVSDSCLKAFVQVTQSTCGSCDGEGNVVAFGGVPPYTYAWSSSMNTDSIETQLCPGVYDVTVTDDIGQQIVVPFGISDNGGPSLTVETTDNDCPGGAIGTATVTGGSNHSWSNSTATGTSISNLTSGTYLVSATDIPGQCTTVVAFDIVEPPAFFVDFDFTFPSNGSNGEIDATVFGGTPPYELLWSTGDTSSMITGLGWGIYTLAITDASGCIFSVDAPLQFPDGVEENAFAARVTLYPNPAGQTVTLKVGKDITGSVLLFDHTGRIVMSRAVNGTGISMDVSSLSSGTYILTLEGEGNVVHRKLIIAGR